MRLNPYFQSQQRTRTVRKRVLRVFVSMVSIAGLGWALLFNPLMRIEYVEVVGASPETAPELTEAIESLLDGHRWLLLPRNHRWLYGSDRLVRQLLARFPLNSVLVSQRHRVLRVDVQEKTRLFYVVQNDRMYALDRMGMLLQEIDDVERARVSVEGERGSGFPILYDERGGGEAIPPAWLESLVVLFDQITARTMLSPRTLTLSDEQGRVDIATDADVTLYMTLARPIDAQLSKLEALLEQNVVDLSALTYIDLRFTHRVFYH